MARDRIEKMIKLKAPLHQVWTALTDHQQFGKWFRVNLEEPFTPGKPARGHITYPGYEHYKWEAVIQKIEPEKLFSFTWHPYAIDKSIDYSQEAPTLVEFKLEMDGNGTFLFLTESGFDRIPASRRDEAYRMNKNGWTEQMKNIVAYLESN